LLKKEVKFPSQQEKEAREEEEKQQRLQQAKIRQISQDVRVTAPELEALLEEMENSFDILVPLHPHSLEHSSATETEYKDTDSTPAPGPALPSVPAEVVLPPETEEEMGLNDLSSYVFSDSDDSSSEESEESSDDESVAYPFPGSMNSTGVKDLRGTGVHSLDYQLDITIRERTDIHQNIDVAAIIPVVDHLIDCLKQLKKRFLPLLKHWTQSLTSMTLVEDSPPHQMKQYCESLLEQVQTSKRKFSELNVNPRYVRQKMKPIRASKAFSTTSHPQKRKRARTQNKPTKIPRHWK